MEIVYKDDKKICEVWLTNDEQDRSELDSLYQMNKLKKYRTVVYLSGKEELYSGTLGLLAHNRKLLI